MCGRYMLTSPVESLRGVFKFEGLPLNLPPRWNIAPTQEAPIVRRRADGKRELKMLRWGLVPFWAKDTSGASRMINARGETVADKPAFRQAFRARRCLIPADGFYEWETIGDKPPREPLLFRMKEGRPFAFAGLWESWKPGDGETLETFTLVNTAANDVMASYHDRVPIVLAPEDYAAWLDPESDPRPLLKAPPSDWFTVTRVSTRVNSVRNDDADCIAPYEAPAPEPAKPKRAAKKDERQGSLF